MLLVNLAVESHVDAFTIQRVVESTFQPDHIVPEANFNEREESFRVIDISNVNNVTSPETNNTEEIVTNIAKENEKGTEKIETSSNITETPDTKANEKILNVTTNDITDTTLSSNHMLNIASSSTTAAEEGSQRDDIESATATESGTTSTESMTSHTDASISSTLEDDSISTITSALDYVSVSTLSTDGTLEDDSVSTSELQNTSEQSATVTGIEDNVTKNGENYTRVNNITNYNSSIILSDNSSSILNDSNNTQQNFDMTKTEVNNDSYSTRTVITTTTTESDLSSKEVDDYTQQESSTASSPISVSENLVQKALDVNIMQDTTTEQNSAEGENTQSVKSDSTESLIPYWKIYKEIDRKRLNSTEQSENSTNSSETLIHAESGQSSPTFFPSLGKEFSISSIPSLDEQTNEPLSLTSELPTNTPISPGTDPIVTLSPTTDAVTQVADVTAALQTSSVIPRIGVVTSLRAGYLDYSSRLTEVPETTAFEENDSTTVTETSVPNLSEEISTGVSFTEFFSKEPSFAAVTTTELATSLMELGSTTSNQETTSESVNQMNITQAVIGLASQSQLVRLICYILYYN